MTSKNVKKMRKQCIEICEELGQNNFNAFMDLGELANQREFLV